jgi:site-specific recombinase XerD
MGLMVEQETLVKIDSLTGQAKVIEVVLNSLNSEHSRRAYERALKEFLLWHQQQGKPMLDKALVQSYVAHLRDKKLSSASINQKLAAIRKLVGEAADGGALDQQTANIIRSVKGVKQEGRKTGNWLTKTQAQQFINCINSNSLKGLRDRVIIALLVGCGLRRNELAELEIAQIQQREGRWVIVDLLGKRNKLRTVPIPSWAKVAVDEWLNATELEQGKLLRPINKGESVYGEAITAQAIRNIVVDYSDQLDLTISPHDLRRTFAKLAHKGGAPLEQIQLALGHSSIKTTEVYLGVEQDLANAPCDFLGLKLEQSPTHNSKQETKMSEQTKPEEPKPRNKPIGIDIGETVSKQLYKNRKEAQKYSISNKEEWDKSINPKEMEKYWPILLRESITKYQTEGRGFIYIEQGKPDQRINYIHQADSRIGIFRANNDAKDELAKLLTQYNPLSEVIVVIISHTISQTAIIETSNSIYLYEAKPVSQKTFHVPGVTMTHQQSPEGRCYYFTHDLLGPLGRLRIIPLGEKQIEARCEVFGNNLSDPLTLQRMAILKPLTEELIKRLELAVAIR